MSPAACAFRVALKQPHQDTNGARIHDTRNEGCLVEMLGKKKHLRCKRFRGYLQWNFRN